MGIDVVIPWVDGTDCQWLEEKEKWKRMINPDEKSNSDIRYQNWDNLKYLFRAIEQNMPWVNHIYFVTCGHLPSFLQTNNPRLRIVRHKDYIPEKYLPTFNANTIEMNFHRIEELSEFFIYFNDDMFPLIQVDEKYYYSDGKVCDEAIETPIIPMLEGDISKFVWNMRALDISVINKHFNKRVVQKTNPEKWFSPIYEELLERNKSLNFWDNFVGFRDPHVPSVLKKSTFSKIWDAEETLLDETCMAKFRGFSGVNQWLVRYWQLCEGDFNPRKTLGKSFSVSAENCEEIAEIIREKKLSMVCINESCTGDEFEYVKKVINNAFETIFPQKSSFEK